MKNGRYIIVLLFSMLSFSVLAQERLIELSTKDKTLKEVIIQLEKNYDFLFSYKEDDVTEINISKSIPSGNIQSFLSNLLQETNLEFEIVDERFIILRKLSSDLSESTQTNFFTICGTVRDSLSQTPLAFANVYLKNSSRGTPTKSDGSFSLKVPIMQRDSLVISYVGYQEKIFSATQFIQKPCKEVALNYLEYDQNFVIVTDYLTDGISLSDHGAKTDLRPNRIGTLPGQVEPDILKSIQFLPGVNAPDGSSSNISVRGGEPDQNLILWEDIPLYHPTHYFGMISGINPFIIDKASVFRGGFDAEYGGRLSSVIDLKSNNTKGDKRFGVGVNLVNAHADGQFDLLKNKASLVFSIRGSSSEIWNTPTFRNITRKIQQGVLFESPNPNRLPKGVRIEDDFSFVESNLKVAYQLSDKDQLNFAWVYGDNDFNALTINNNRMQRFLNDLYLKNNGLSLSWKRQWNSSISTKLLLVDTDYQYDYNYRIDSDGSSVPDKEGFKNNQIKERQLKFTTDFQTKNNHLFKLGYQIANYDVGFELSKVAQENQHANENSQINANLHTLFTSYNSSKEKRFGINAGLRANYFDKEKGYYFEPRLRLWCKASNSVNLYFNTGKYYQFLSQLIQIEGDQSSIDLPVWVLTGEREVPVLNAVQSQVGIIYNKNNWVVDFQAYYKKILGLSSLATGFDDNLNNRYLLGEAEIRGLDILIKKRWKNYRNWISYSYSEADHHFEDFFDSDFVAPNDQPHSFHIVHMLKVKNFDFSLGWKISSGLPYSLREYYEIKINPPGMGPRETIRPIVKTFNSERLPALHQLDASVSYTILPKGDKKWKGLIGLSLLNIYNQNNLYSRAFLIDVRANQMPMLNYINKVDLGFTPNLMIRWEW